MKNGETKFGLAYYLDDIRKIEGRKNQIKNCQCFIEKLDLEEPLKELKYLDSEESIEKWIIVAHKRTLDSFLKDKEKKKYIDELCKSKLKNLVILLEGDDILFKENNPYNLSNCKSWVTGADSIFNYLNDFVEYIQKTPYEDWQPGGWLKKHIFISALSILCQGHLVAHFPTLEKASDTVKIALNRMGWTRFIASDNGKGFNIQQPEITENPQWWQKILGEEKEKLKETFSKEWGNKTPLPSEINKLIKAIFDPIQLKGEDCNKRIAKVYLQLAEKLKGTIS